MPDIFISYSRTDSAQAEQLAELLTSAGLSCWIDRQGIDLATSWSREIVQAINECKAFVVLLSPASIVSNNVIKEISLASEKRKKILPLDLEPVALTEDFEYQLAGLQRSPMTNIDAIIRALAKLGLEATGAPQAPKIVKETDSRKSLMILPFEDLSPTGDNGWFADGLASELISALCNVKSLRVSDPQATKEFKGYKGQLAVYAKGMGVRFFVQGDVRKFRDNIKITCRLLDIETGDFLWQDSMKGTMQDIFEIQENVAEKVVAGLKIHLGSEEKKQLAKHGTHSTEAYELCMKADEYFGRQTQDGIRLCLQLNTEAITLDPGFVRPYLAKANALTVIYRTYNPDPSLLDEAEALCKEALRLEPDQFKAYQPLSRVYAYRGMFAEAEEAAQEYVRKDPLNAFAQANLGSFYMNTGQPKKAIAPLEESIRLKPNDRVKIWNLVLSCDLASEREKCSHWASLALPQFERHLKLHPDDENILVQHAALLQMSGQTEAARAAAIRLTSLQDGASLFNAACLFGKLGDKPQALRTCFKAINEGYRNIKQLKVFLTDDEGVASSIGTTEYEELRQMVEKIQRETETKKNA
jgi:TolB-like protein/Tfp pilus assembly protein PilF